MRQGIGYLGTSEWQTTSAINTEIIPSPPAEFKWTMGYNLFKFSFYNPDQEAKVIINGKHELLIPKGVGFNIDSQDSPIWSFVVKDIGVRYCFTGSY